MRTLVGVVLVLIAIAVSLWIWETVGREREARAVQQLEERRREIAKRPRNYGDTESWKHWTPPR